MHRCHGTGNVVKEKDRCKKCAGEKILTIEKEFTVFIQPGQQDGDTLTFEGEGNQVKDNDIKEEDISDV
ncbi:MAG: hypothetical protein EZS28_001403 [Streblomastix strix]|uniref:Chaperone DnaJ C-terminal domain-containing protein n=1 Tax=Streblomastix strix TaxID=222440 RepID=A0A5J4X730_9EUKA|nr:MAG: hypothetical protein EZS28_001403 [Streblomastix strix]